MDVLSAKKALNHQHEIVIKPKKLGFKERRVGRGKHANKFTHPTKHTQDSRIQRDFIIIPHKVYPVLSTHIVKGLTLFGFSLEEIQEACR